MVYKKNVTYIQDLDDIGQIEHFRPKNLPPPPQNAIRTKKYNNPYDEMNRTRGQMSQLFRENFNNKSNMGNFNNPQYMGGTPSYRDVEPQMSPIPSNNNMENKDVKESINCLDVCNHIKDCPLCSQFYNNDKTIYIIIIVMLCILNLIFLKKILNL